MFPDDCLKTENIKSNPFPLYSIGLIQRNYTQYSVFLIFFLWNGTVWPQAEFINFFTNLIFMTFLNNLYPSLRLLFNHLIRKNLINAQCVALPKLQGNAQTQDTGHQRIIMFHCFIIICNIIRQNYVKII